MKLTPVQIFQKTATNLARATVNLRTRVGHWSPYIGQALEKAVLATQETADQLAALDPSWTPPRKTATRSYESIVAGDRVRVSNRHLTRTPEPLRGVDLEVVATERTIITVKAPTGICFGVERKSLKLVTAPKRAKNNAAAPTEASA